MRSEAIWFVICPWCDGVGKTEILTVLSHNALRKNATEGFPKVCEPCEGKGELLIVKKMRKGQSNG